MLRVSQIAAAHPAASSGACKVLPHKIRIIQIQTHVEDACSLSPKQGDGYSFKINNLKFKEDLRIHLLPFIASTKARNGGDGLPGRDFISGWNCEAKKNGCSGISQISIRSPFVPENFIPFSSIWAM